MTVTQRKAQPVQDEVPTVHEPGEQYQCDACACDLTHTVRIKCADPVCTSTEEGVDICPPCFCAGKEFGNHKRGHAYRIIEFNSYPIFTEDWGADEELLLIKGIASQGLGNWKKISEHVGTRTKEEVEQHYTSVYVNSPAWPLPEMNKQFDISSSEFQSRKRKRIAEMHMVPPPPLKPAPVSVPGIHEIATYLPGRLEFEHEIDNEAEDVVKDLEFGVCLEFGGDEIPIDENDLDIKAKVKWEEEKKNGGPPPALPPAPATKTAPPAVNGVSNTIQDVKMENADDENTIEEVTGPPPVETSDSIAFKFTLIDMYRDRVAKREEAKAIMFDRGLLEYKKMQAADKKRPKEERETLHRMRPFARLQSSEDYENFTSDILYEGMLRKRIQELQQYRRLGLVTPADIERYDLDLTRRTQAKTASYASDKYRNSVGRLSTGPTDERKETPDSAGGPSASASSSGPSAPRRPGPLNLSNSPSLHLLTPGEQLLCSQLRILPKPYLVIKETLVREYARRGGKLRRREARDLVKVDANKTSRVWDFLVQTGFLKINDPVVAPNPVPAVGQGQTQQQQQDAGAGPSNSPSVSGSPVKSLASLNGNGAS